MAAWAHSPVLLYPGFLLHLPPPFLGAILIGIVVGAAWDQGPWGPLRAAVLKTGFCGGLTTFSTFSLESLSLLESGRYGIATIYIASSLILSIAGVCLGRSLF